MRKICLKKMSFLESIYKIRTNYQKEEIKSLQEQAIEMNKTIKVLNEQLIEKEKVLKKKEKL